MSQVFQGPFAGKILLTVLNTVVSLVIFTLFLARSDLVLSAFVTAVLFTIGKSLIGNYRGRAASSSPYGAAGALIILMFVHVLFGAELTKTIPDGRAPADRQAQRGTIHQSESSFLTKNR